MDFDITPYHSTEFDASLCMGRRVTEDRHWTPRVYSARQCSNKPVNGTDLCTTCHKHLEKGASAYKGWQGRVGDNLTTLPPESHVVGSTWFNTNYLSGKLKWSSEPVPVRQRVPAAAIPAAPAAAGPVDPEMQEPEVQEDPVPQAPTAEQYVLLLNLNKLLVGQAALLEEQNNLLKAKCLRLEEKQAAAIALLN